jgi:hypothetical protein
MEQRKKMGGVNAARENNQQIQKQIKILENRLDKVGSGPGAGLNPSQSCSCSGAVPGLGFRVEG